MGPRLENRTFIAKVRKGMSDDRVVGPLLTLVVIGVHYALSFTPLKYSNRIAPLMLVVVYSTFRGGKKPGLISAALAYVYFVMLFGADGTFVKEPSLVWVRVITWLFVFPMTVQLVGNLKLQVLRKESAEVQRSLEEAKLLLDSILTNVCLSIWSVDTNGIFISYRGSVSEKIGIKPEARPGTSLFDLLKERPDIESEVREGLRQGEPRNVEMQIKEQWFEIHISPLKNLQGELIGAAGISVDITDRKVADSEKAELHASEQAALQSSRMKSEFLANMSHEIRTPINGVMGMASLLLDSSLSEEQRSYSETIRSSADSLLTLVNDILDFSKVEAGKLSLEVIHFELDEVLLEIERTLVVSAKQKGLKLLKSASTDIPAFIQGDPTRLKQVLLNLVNNAIKFTPSGHVIIETVRLAGEGGKDWLRIEVADTGIGISTSARNRIFDAFSQADSSTTRRFGGTGLGLTICRHLVKLMGGEIGVTSDEGKGSTSWFTIPLVAGQAPGEASSGQCLEASGAKKLHVLVAEDNSVNRIIAVKMLEKLGHSAIAVTNGNEAIDALRSSRYDLILMDCQMPELDGYEATKIIRTAKTIEQRDIAIIAMTANALQGDRERCLAAGMDEYLSKPMKTSDLREIIERTLRAKHLAA